MEAAKSAYDVTQKNVAAIAEMEQAYENSRTRGERLADTFAAIVGSWTFIGVQSAILSVWVVLNIVGWIKSWDPYPFILLNLALSFQAAYSSPIIMMSQNRQANLSDRRNKLDLQINLLAEQENTEMLVMLRQICEKLEIPMTNNHSVKALEQNIKPETVVDQIDQIIKETTKQPGAA
jgi:uncharacterized membrane protein